MLVFVMAKTDDELVKIKQIILDEFPQSPEGQLMASIIGKCVEDIYYPERRYSEVNTAIHYLNGDMYHAEMCGVDPDWIRDLILKHKPNALREPWRK